MTDFTAPPPSPLNYVPGWSTPESLRNKQMLLWLFIYFFSRYFIKNRMTVVISNAVCVHTECHYIDRYGQIRHCQVQLLKLNGGDASARRGSAGGGQRVAPPKASASRRGVVTRKNAMRQTAVADDDDDEDDETPRGRWSTGRTHTYPSSVRWPDRDVSPTDEDD